MLYVNHLFKAKTVYKNASRSDVMDIAERAEGYTMLECCVKALLKTPQRDM